MTFEKATVILERNRRLEAILGALLACMFIGGVAQVFVAGGQPWLLYLLSVPMGLLNRVSRDHWRARRREARVRADVDGIFVDDRRIGTASAAMNAIVQPRAGKKPTVRVRAKNHDLLLELEVDDEAEGVAFLRAIGHDASAKKMVFRAKSPFLSTPRRAAVWMAGVVAGWMGVPLLLMSFAHATLGMAAIVFIALVVPFVWTIRPRAVEVGADGLTLTWWKRSRFVPFDDVVRVETPASDTVRLVLQRGETLALRASGGDGWGGSEQATLQRDAMLRRIVEATDAHRARVGPRELAAHLARGDRDANVWLAHLRSLADSEAGYRAPAVREEDLWRIVEDPGAPEDARAAAAVLLRKTEGAKPRLRVAAEAVASPRLRVAFETEEEENAERVLEAYLPR